MARQTGLKDITIAVLTKDDSTGVTYAAPQKLERSIKATIKPKSSQTKLYSDDSVEEVINSFDSIDVEIELNQLTVASRALLQGAKVVKGVLVETKNDIPPTIALGFKSAKSNGKSRFVWLYKGSFELTEDSFETQEDKLKTSTAKLKGTFYAREYDGAYRIIADEDTPNVDTTTITNWFTAVQSQPIGGIITTITVVAGMSGVVSGIAGTVITCTTAKTVAQLKTALQVDTGKGSFKVWASSAKTTYALDVATVVNTMVVEATAEDGVTKATYTITVA